MPHYSYSCPECDWSGWISRRISEADEPTECPTCTAAMARNFAPQFFAPRSVVSPAGAPADSVKRAKRIGQRSDLTIRGLHIANAIDGAVGVRIGAGNDVEFVGFTAVNIGVAIEADEDATIKIRHGYHDPGDGTEVARPELDRIRAKVMKKVMREEKRASGRED